MATTDIISYFSFAQQGDFIGGAESFENIGFKRKAMNVYFMKTSETDVCFKGRMNEDVNAYLYLGQRGKFIFTINDVSINQSTTQKISGGMTELYDENGTYQKSFYSVIVSPNCVKVSSMGNINQRLHHKINWEKAVPKLIREEMKK